MKNKALNRSRINNELKNMFDYPLTIVSATMGYGKTTSVLNFLDSHTVKCAWVSCLGCSDMESMFWKRLTTAIKKVCPNLCEELEQAGFPVSAQQMTDNFELFKKRKDTSPTVIVLDDYHLLENNRILNTYIELFTQEKIPNLHLILISRTYPSFNHIFLKSKGLCYYIDNDTLAFTLEETASYFRYMNVNVTQEEIKSINNYTKGWISAIYLLAAGLQKGIPVSATFDINQLVDDNYYHFFDSETKLILMYLSIFDCFTLKQATEILQNKNVPRIIKNLVQQNAFVSLDKHTGVYSIHNVLLNLLREKVSLNEIDMYPTYYSAGKWYLDNGEMHLAFKFYDKAHKIDELLVYINDIQHLDIHLIDEALLQKIFEHIPLDTYILLPFPLLQFAFNFIFSGECKHLEKAKKIIDRLRTYYTTENVSANIKNKILGEIEILTIFLVFNDTEKMIEHSQKADVLLNGDVSCVVYQHDPFAFGIPCFLYAYYREPGKLKETVDSINRGFPPRVFDGCGTGCELLAIAEAALEQGDSVTAEHFVNMSIYKAQTKKQYGIILCAKFAVMRLCLLTGQPDEAINQLLQTKTWLLQVRLEMTSINYATFQTTIAMCEAYIYGCLKMKESIPNWVRTGDMNQGYFLLKGLAFPCIIFGRAVLLSENWVKLEVLCESFREKYEIHHNQLGLIHNAIYRAVAQMNLHGLGAGIKTLLPALIDAQKDDIVLPFAENADYILPMLYILQENREIDSSYLSSLISVCEQYKNILILKNSNSIKLTNREEEILMLLAQGLTKKEIANQTFLSVSSIKRSIENIYVKLNVNNKQKAIMKFKGLNLARSQQ